MLAENDSKLQTLEKQPSQGHIVTENPALLALLRGDTMDQANQKPVQRVYVDSPILDSIEADNYRWGNRHMFFNHKMTNVTVIDFAVNW